MKRILSAIILILGSTLFSILFADKLSAESHKLDIAIQNCYYAKKFAETIIQKRKAYRPISYYDRIEFTSPVAMEIVLEAYNTAQKEPEFSDGWFKKCQEISCSEFWADLDVSIRLVSD